MKDMERAKAIISEKNCTCVLVKDDTVYESSRRGIGPLMELLEAGTDCRGFSAADKVVGRATAFLYARLGVAAVHALTISRGAAEVLHECGLVFSYDEMTDAILNRTKDGFCPMESAVRDINDQDTAFSVLQETYRRLSGRQ